jgi:predicted nuclease of predicted toxin-antitoxin system
MKFLVDMPLSPVLAQWLSDKGHDAVHAAQRGLERADDATILRLAREEGAIVLTADLDYPRLLALTGSDGPGILLFRGGELGGDGDPRAFGAYSRDCVRGRNAAFDPGHRTRPHSATATPGHVPE